jgi:hypothetical protein
MTSPDTPHIPATPPSASLAPHPLTPAGGKAGARRRRFLPRSWRGWLLLVCVCLLAVLGTAWILSRSAPPWYAPLDASDQRVIDLSDRGQAVLLDLHNKVQRVPIGEQTWTITQEELNSYIAIQFARLVDAGGAGPAPVVSQPAVIFSPGQVTVCARTTRLPSPHKLGGVASLVFDVRIVPGSGAADKPMGLVQLRGVWAGCLPVPQSLVETRLRALVPAITAAVQQAVQMQFNERESSQWTRAAEQLVHKAAVGEPFPLEIKVDRKHIAVKDFQVEEGRFTVVMAPPAPSPMPIPGTPIVAPPAH